MRIRKISNNKIVVRLTDTDLEYFDVDFEKSTPEAADLHKFLFKIMELVKEETGFDPYNGGQVVVEASPDDTGISIVISKIKTSKKKISREEFSKIKRIKVKGNKKTNHTNIKPYPSKNTTFIFNSFADLESAINVIGSFDFEKTALYKNEQKYALITDLKPCDAEFNILSEYAYHIVSRNVSNLDIKEGWKHVASGQDMTIMAKRLNDMQ